MSKKKMNEFKKELKALLEKYNMSIGLIADDSSDWWGITGEEIVASPNGSNEIEPLNDGGTWLSAGDL